MRLNGEEEKTPKEEGGGGGVGLRFGCVRLSGMVTFYSPKKDKKNKNNNVKKIIFSALLISLGSLPPSLSST